MILQEPRYFLALVPFFILSVWFFRRLKRIFKEYKYSKNTSSTFIKIFYSLIFLGIIFLGIRGRVQRKSPIRIGTAYYCDNAFLNQLGLNPTYTLLDTYFESISSKNKRVSLMDDKQAITYVKNSLSIDSQEEKYSILRHVVGDSTRSSKPNVVLIIMESMSIAKMKKGGSTLNLTPFLDSLLYHSLYFENVYTTGMHTFNGIFSTLFSFPALYRKHPMKGKPIKYTGVSSVLKQNGYTTTYFTTHDGQFDNAEGFLRHNDFDNVVTQSDYPSEEVKTTLGVPDDYMFRFSLPIIDNYYKEGKPFFVTYMTASDHGPYYIPPYFKPRNPEIRHQTTEYADWSLERFIAQASEKDWFSNTIFVFVADHGGSLNVTYETPLNFYHTPLIFYAPEIYKSPKIYKHVGSQIDIFPTIMGLLNLSYTNNTLGVDLLKQKRSYAILNGDDKVGVIDKEFLLIMKEGKPSKIYKHRSLDRKDYRESYLDKVEEMELYAKSHLQVYQYLLDHPSLLNVE